MSNDRTELLRRFPLWGTFSDELLQVVGEAMEAVSYEAGEAIIRRGEPGQRFSVMVSGRADVRILTQAGSVITVSSMKEGDSFGEMSLLSEDPTSADVVATERCETLALGREAFHGLISGNPVLLREFVRLLSRRVKAADVAVGVARQKEEDLTRFLKDREAGLSSVLVGKSKLIRDLQKQIEAKSGLRSPLLIRGEKGTGRKLVARLIHSRGPREDAPMVSTDCGQITESPWGDQLFGLYDQAVASSARAPSHLALADGGTLLLVDVTAMPPAIQERLARFLHGDALPGGFRPDVRVVATCRQNLLEEAAAGRFSAELAALLLGDVIELPPLREHKRDIPELARHFVARHAQRLGRKVPAVDDETMVRLISYDYGFANVQELEESIVRAVVLSDGDTINPDAVFLGPPPRESPRGFNLLGLPKPVVKAALRLFPSGVRAIATLVFVVILFGCFAVAGGPGGNFATVLVWAVWWPALVLSFFFAARAWCAVCPMAVSGELAQGLVRRFSKVERSIPAWLRNNDATFGMAGFFLIAWAEEVTHMRTSPVATGFLLLAIISGALVTGAVLPRRAWCRHLCPMGAFAGLCSTSSLLELRPTQDICSAKCQGHACYKGDAAVAGCPMFQHVMFVDTNKDCVLCLNCVRLCPNGSPQLNLRLPAREIWTSVTARPQAAAFVVLLLGLLLGQTLVQYLEGPGAAFASAALEEHRLLLVTALLVSCAAIPLGLFRLASRQLEKDPDTVLRTLHWQRVTAWAPLLVAGYAAYQFANIPGFDRLRVTLGGLGGPDPLLSLRVLPTLQGLTLLSGLVVTIAALRKIWPPEKAEAGFRWYRGQTLGLVSAAGYAALLFLVMAMKAAGTHA